MTIAHMSAFTDFCPYFCIYFCFNFRCQNSWILPRLFQQLFLSFYSLG